MGITRQDELKDIKARLKNLVPNSEIVACHEANIQIKVVYVHYKKFYYKWIPCNCFCILKRSTTCTYLIKLQSCSFIAGEDFVPCSK